jgi:hypothetical protein
LGAADVHLFTERHVQNASILHAAATTPRPAVLKRRRVVRVTGRSHKRTAAGGEINNVTRGVTVTFRRR